MLPEGRQPSRGDFDFRRDPRSPVLQNQGGDTISVDRKHGVAVASPARYTHAPPSPQLSPVHGPVGKTGPVGAHLREFANQTSFIHIFTSTQTDIFKFFICIKNNKLQPSRLFL